MTRIFVMFLLVLGICQAKVGLIYRLPSGVAIPTAYELHFTPDMEKLRFEGEVNITLIALITNDTLTLNAKGLTFHEVNFVDLNTTTTLENNYIKDEEHEIVNITIKPQFEKDHHYSLQIKYSGIVRYDWTGFYRYTIEQGGKEIFFGTTQFEPSYARLVFPCWDEPIYKAKFNISLTHDKTQQAISNMDVLKTEEEDDKITTSFKETPVMSTYLLAFVIGNYQFKEDKVGNFTYRVWARENYINRTDYILKTGRQIVERMNLYTNISYETYMPDKLDQAMVRVFFPSLGMENWGLVIYRESAVLHNEATALTRTKINTLMIIIHELSHLWFGNLVTPTWWKYLWVKEGFASYFQYFLASEIAPEFRLDDMFVVESMQENAMVMDGVPEARPLNKDVITPEDVAESYTPMVYDKASSIIRMISHAMTEEVFHKGVKIYLTSHALGNADSNDLFESFQKALNESGIEWKQPMQVLMHNWVECPGYPTVTVKRVHGNYQLTQERLVIALGENQKYPTKWWIPINYVEESNPNFTNTAIVDWFSPNDTSHTVPSKTKTGWFVFNTQQTGYYRVNYDVENWELLIKELNKGNDTKIHVLNRVQMIDDVFNLAHVDSLNYTIALKVALYLTNEADYMPWQPALRHLGFLRNLLRTSNKYYIFMRYVAHLTKTLTKEIGYEPKANDSDLDKMLRINAMRWACEAGVKSCISYAEKTYQQWLENPLMKLDVNLKTEILCAGVRNANESAWNNTLGHILASTPDEDKRKDQLVALACSNSSEILMTYLNSTLNSGTKVFFSTAARDVVSRYPGGAQLVLNFVIKEQKRIEKSRFYELGLTQTAEAIAGAITNEQQRVDLSNFLLNRQLVRPFEVVMAKAAENMDWIDKYKSTVDKWLDANNRLFESTDVKHWGNSASLMAVASSYVIFSLFITRFY